MSSAHSYSLVELLQMAVTGLVGNIPMLLAYAAALIFVIVRWRQSPRASTLALCGVLFGLLLLLLVPVAYAWLSRSVMTGGKSSLEMQTAYTVAGLAVSSLHAISFGFLFLAIYADRRHYNSPPPPEG
ncbi:hypothetical protein DES53_105237 [Roseimicrobium gellanilyticum]|uniref:Uncharacterized protein n=1 Tax=Roseimicrobium gellanilyticum TaxID=748857 RepID=A0A366HLM5_9BACT|nr:hypothetical protein [Roseimicrobium gellanilyticum]RBP43838.1 hypothetical protein DES53_105237 [Roseimicrobium gellanilyticum]